MQWDSGEAQEEEGAWRGEGHPRIRAWLWRLGFALAIVFAWAWIGLYFMLLALGAMGDCFGLQPCTDLQQQGMVDGTHWGELFAACAFVASGLGIAVAMGIRRAAVALVVFSVAVATITFSQPSSEVGMRGTGFMAVALAPLVVLAAWKWWSSRA